jgi:hypothetical protein
VTHAETTGTGTTKKCSLQGGARDGISGTIGTLVVDRDYVEDAVAFPIDALVVDLSKLDDDLIDEDGII